MSRLTQESLGNEAAIFSALESQHQEASLYGVTDGKAIGTYLEQKFKLYLKEKYDFVEGNAASGIDFPELLVDIKVTSTKQPQSSCTFKSARQKIFGLGYSLIIFVYEKLDNSLNRTANLRMITTIFVSAERRADFQMNRGIRNILNNQGNKDDLIAFMLDKNLPVDEMEAANIADEILANPPVQGFLTISNALQCRLQYTRVIDLAGQEEGLIAIYREN
ncbi:restriction endonuclease [Microcystis sp. LEGE 08355]|uniref:restriction endonuclease n=1 Tax=Microcystis sp. LEGE 08355 TaxID=1828687 RepID=UPI00187DEFF9|nr:restriction endonuclease [Microcystis sp. LEGE 08355]MBE9072142.1 restriction endonuclease [Microcystis sp. LEGE 08355]